LALGAKSSLALVNDTKDSLKRREDANTAKRRKKINNTS
jgi:hypothetical protein